MGKGGEQEAWSTFPICGYTAFRSYVAAFLLALIIIRYSVVVLGPPFRIHFHANKAMETLFSQRLSRGHVKNVSIFPSLLLSVCNFSTLLAFLHPFTRDLRTKCWFSAVDINCISVRVLSYIQFPLLFGLICWTLTWNDDLILYIDWVVLREILVWQ